MNFARAHSIRLSDHLEDLKDKIGGPASDLPAVSTLAALMKHGGFQVLSTSEIVTTKLHRLLPATDVGQHAKVADEIKHRADDFFYRLADTTYTIPSNLMSYLAFPHEGTTYTPNPFTSAGGGCPPTPIASVGASMAAAAEVAGQAGKEHDANHGATAEVAQSSTQTSTQAGTSAVPQPQRDACENPIIPAAFTFVGQFVDHDLTFNGLDLFADEMEENRKHNPDLATPLIDLDHIYGPRFNIHGEPQTVATRIYDPQMRFHLSEVQDDTTGTHVPYGYDLPRTDVGAAYIFDPRNDENQLILQTHVLLMRLHNRLIRGIYAEAPGLDPMTAVLAARKETVATWQSVLLNDYLPKIIQKETLDFVLGEVVKPGYGELVYKPDTEGRVRMPHEFAIGFRFGHSQLRSAYTINAGAPLCLFRREPSGAILDLRGSKSLSASHVLDWDVFYPKGQPNTHKSLRIDSKVTHVVFDLPESAIPDNVKYIGNLPHRNLIRSRQIDLTCGEDLAELYSIPNPLAHIEVESDKDAWPYFEQEGNRFKTPLWYYILKEAEMRGVAPAAAPPVEDGCKEKGGYQLGPLGSRLIAEVIVGGIYYGKEFGWNPAWKSVVKKQLGYGETSTVMLRDIIDFVGPKEQL